MHACSSSCAKEGFQQKKDEKKIHFVIIEIEFTPLRHVYTFCIHILKHIIKKAPQREESTEKQGGR